MLTQFTKEIYTYDEVLGLLEVSKSTLNRYRFEQGLRFHKKGRKVFFLHSEILKWMQK